MTSVSPDRFYAIAHRAGNNLHHLEQALDAHVDAIECDLWHDHGRLALRHERKLPGIPLLYDRWYLRWSWGELRLRDLVREIDLRSDLFLDIKSSTPKAADAVLELLADVDVPMPRTLVSSRQWHLLDRLAEARSDLGMFYSVGRRSQIAPLLRRCEGTLPPAGASIRHTLLSAAVVARLHDARLQVYAWCVNTPHRGEELLHWGVDGLISDEPGLLRALEMEH